MTTAIASAAGVYQIVNSVNGKVYVGSTCCLSRRWAEHRKKMRAGTSSCTRLQGAWNKYGERCFQFTVLEIVPASQDVLAREQYWLDQLRPAYNVMTVAGRCTGYRHTAETRALLARVARPITSGHREKMLAGLRNMSPEAKAVQRARMSASSRRLKPMLGKKQSEATKQKKAETMRKLCSSPEARARLKAASQRRWSLYRASASQ